jgi:hypothetical protein
MMGCCGNNRRPLPVENNETPHVTFTPPAPTFQYFEYVGKTSLTAIGNVTGHRYRFAGPGVAVEVDSRDAPSMAGVPNVRRVKSND